MYTEIKANHGYTTCIAESWWLLMVELEPVIVKICDFKCLLCISTSLEHINHQRPEVKHLVLFFLLVDLYETYHHYNIYLFIYLFIYLLIYLFIYVYLFICLFICLFVLCSSISFILIFSDRKAYTTPFDIEAIGVFTGAKT